MAHSTLKTTAKLTLALFLPLYMRGCNLFQFGITVAVTVAVAYLVLSTTDHTNTPGHTTRTKFLLMLCAVFTASCISDFVLKDPWARMILTYFMSWDSLWLLVPLVDPQHEARISKLRASHRTAPEMLIPLLISGCAVFHSTRVGLLQRHGYDIILVLNSILVFFAVVGPLQHVAVFLVSLTTKEMAESGTPSFVDEHTATGPKHKERMMQDSSPDMVYLSKMAHLENLNIPKDQTRPSTRRRG